MVISPVHNNSETTRIAVTGALAALWKPSWRPHAGFPDGGVGPPIGHLNPDQITADLNAVADYGVKLPSAVNKLFVAAFCSGGGQTFRFSTNRPDLSAALVWTPVYARPFRPLRNR
jgi:dienelactone hydrolase